MRSAASQQNPEPAPAVETLFSWGIFETGYPPDNHRLDDLTAALGRRPGLVAWYVLAPSKYPPGTIGGPAWTDNAARVRALLAAGQVPLITWEMWAADAGANPMPLADITAGKFDAYYDSWAAGIKAVTPGLVYLRIFHEMNLTAQYPWSIHAGNSSGNTPRQLADAWRHIVGRFQAAGVENVRWVFNVGGDLANNPLAAEGYPGDEYVDYIGADIYDGAPSGSVALDELLLARIANKPWLMGEVGGSAEWVTNELAPLTKRRPVTIVWFNAAPSPLTGQPAVIRAVKEMLASLGTPTGGTGTIVSGLIPRGGGFGLFVFGGGTVQQLTAVAGCPISAMAVWATVGGSFVAYIPGTAISAVNAEFFAVFPGGMIPPATGFIGKCV